MAGWPQHNISAVATRAMDRWRYLAIEGLSWSRLWNRPKSLDQVEAFTAAYRRSATELARVRAFSPDRRLAEFIEEGLANAHFAVYRGERPRVVQVIRGVLFGFPALVRKYAGYHLLSLVILMVSTLIAHFSVTYFPETYFLFVDAGLASGRDPSASKEALASSLGPQDTGASSDALFSSFLFTHNTRVAFMCFAWGVLLGLPTIYMLIKTGLMLGAFTALFMNKGLGVEFFAWILPHGVPEIGAIILCGGAGMALGHCILNPGNRPRGVALRQTAADASLTALGCVPLLALAGVIEGSFRQSNASLELRYALFALLLVGGLVWIILARGVSERRQTKNVKGVQVTAA